MAYFEFVAVTAILLSSKELLQEQTDTLTFQCREAPFRPALSLALLCLSVFNLRDPHDGGDQAHAERLAAVATEEVNAQEVRFLSVSVE